MQARKAAAKASAAQRANADLRNTPNSVPDTQNDGMMFNVEEFDDDIMLDTAATVYPSRTGLYSSSFSSSSSQVEREPVSTNSMGIYYDQFGAQ